MSENQFPIYGVKVKVPRSNPEIWAKATPPPPKAPVPVQVAPKQQPKTSNNVRSNRNYQSETRAGIAYSGYCARVSAIQNAEMKKLLLQKK